MSIWPNNDTEHPGMWNIVCEHIVETERNIRVVVVWCSCWTGAGRGRGTPRYCRSMDWVGSTELNFNPTRAKSKKKRKWANFKNQSHYLFWVDCWCATDLPATQDGWLVCISGQVVPALGTLHSEPTSPHQSQDQLRDKSDNLSQARAAMPQGPNVAGKEF